MTFLAAVLARWSPLLAASLLCRSAAAAALHVPAVSEMCRPGNEARALQPRGAHVLLDFEGFLMDPVEGGAWISELMESTVLAHGVRVVHQKLVQLPVNALESPPGFTAVCLLDESHATAHCYSDTGLLAIDIFTCGGHDPQPIATCIRRQIEARTGALCVQHAVHGRFLHHEQELAPSVE